MGPSPATAISGVVFGDGAHIPGGVHIENLTVQHGVTKKVTLPVTLGGEVKDPWGNTRAGFEIETTLDRKAYGIVWNKALDSGGVMLGDDVKVAINLETVKKVDKPAAKGK